MLRTVHQVPVEMIFDCVEILDCAHLFWCLMVYFRRKSKRSITREDEKVVVGDMETCEV